MALDEGDFVVEISRLDATVRKLFDLERDRDAGAARTFFDLVRLGAAFQPERCGESLVTEAKFSAEVSDLHAPVFAYCEHVRKRRVRNMHADNRRGLSQHANMAKRDLGPVDYEALREASGWYAAAWRDFKKITQQELADEVGSSRGQVSDLETGAKTRYNRDWVKKFSDALGVRPGFLIDVNPFTMWEGQDRLEDAVRRLSTDDRNAVLDMATRLVPKTGTDG